MSLDKILNFSRIFKNCIYEKYSQKIYYFFQKPPNYPDTFYDLLYLYPDLFTELDELPCTINAKNIVRWHEWGREPSNLEGAATGWRQHIGGAYQLFRVHLDEFIHFGDTVISENWTCDIRDIMGLTASKSDLNSFDSLDCMAEKKASHLINKLDHDSLQKNLRHPEIRILNHSSANDHFIRYSWDERLFISNSGGSHHFAAARYIAGRLETPVPLCATLYTYSINNQALVHLCKNFQMFVMNTDLPEAFWIFHECMRRYHAPYFLKSLPYPYYNCRALLLPKCELRSMQVADVLQEAESFDLGAYLQKLFLKNKNKRL